MRIVAIETTELTGSIAAFEADDLVAELTLPPGRRSAETLAPEMVQLLDLAVWQPQQVDLVAVSVGPGSFTGLRVGVTTAKAFAYAVDAEIIGVPTLGAIVYRAPDQATPLWVVSDAHRQQVFATRVLSNRPRPGCDCDTDDGIALLPLEQWLGALKEGDWVTGPVLSKYCERLPTTVQVVDRSLWSPTAAAVGRIGWIRYQGGKRDDLWKLVPRYVRKSAAEEQWQDA